MARIWVESYGCSASMADSEIISGIISNEGHTLAGSHEEADAGLIVTCSVKDATASRMIHRIKKMSSKPLIVAGCLPKAEQGTVEKIAKDASMLGPGSLGRVPAVLRAALEGRKAVELGETDMTKSGLPRIRLNEAVGIIEIARGCMSECTFCQTKLAKGDLRSYRVGDIMRQAKSDITSGCREIWLSSTDNGCYGLDIGASLPELVDAISGIEGDFRVRVGMMNPMYMPGIRDGLLRSYDNPKVYKFLHVPVQSGSDGILRQMRRGHTSGTFLDAVKRFRGKFGDFTISTDVIVGFPGESDSDFERTVNLLEEARPEVTNLSKYSARPGTEAAGMAQTDPATVRRRSKKIHELASQISREANRRWVGWKGTVLFDEVMEGHIKGRNMAYKAIYISDEVGMGQTHTVRVTGYTDHSLTGEIAS